MTERKIEMKSPFALVNTDGEYDDYEFYLPDCGGYGGRIRITFVKKDGKVDYAYLVTCGDTTDGGYIFEQEADVPLEWALAMVGKGETDEENDSCV